MSMWVPNSESGPKIQSLEGENEIPQIGIIIQKLQCSLVNCLRLGRKAVKMLSYFMIFRSHFAPAPVNLFVASKLEILSAVILISTNEVFEVPEILFCRIVSSNLGPPPRQEPLGAVQIEPPSGEVVLGL